MKNRNDFESISVPLTVRIAFQANAKQEWQTAAIITLDFGDCTLIFPNIRNDIEMW